LSSRVFVIYKDNIFVVLADGYTLNKDEMCFNFHQFCDFVVFCRVLVGHYKPSKWMAMW